MSKSELFNIAEMAKGALIEQFDQEFSRVLENIADPNTDPKKARKIQITLTFKPNEHRNSAEINFQTKPTLVPSKPLSTQIVIDKDRDGKVVAAEFGGGIPGQMDVDEVVEENERRNVVNFNK